MTGKEALADYTAAARELDVFEFTFKQVVTQLESLRTHASQTLSDLRVVVRETGEDVENRYFKTVTIEKTHRAFDPGVLEAEVPEVVAATVGLIVKTVDRDIADALVRQGVITQAVAADATVEEPMTPAVHVKAKSRLYSRKTVKAEKVLV